MLIILSCLTNIHCRGDWFDSPVQVGNLCYYMVKFTEHILFYSATPSCVICFMSLATDFLKIFDGPSKHNKYFR